MSKVSVIVPVYNADQYVGKCIDSILAQSLTDLELIIVDDGSTDNSGAICDDYAFRDARISVIHQQNGGSASARQAGLETSKGEYISFVDSDDWISADMLEVMVTKAEEEKADIVICDFYKVFKRGLQLVSMNPGQLENLDFMQYIISRGGGSLCNKLIRKACFTNPKKIGFERGINVFEDMLMMAMIALAERKVTYIPLPLYYYNQEKTDSYMHSPKYTHRVVFNNALVKHLDRKKHASIITSLGHHEAFTAFNEGTFSASEWKKRFSSIDYKEDAFMPFYYRVATKFNYSLGRILMLTNQFVHRAYWKIF